MFWNHSDNFIIFIYNWKIFTMRIAKDFLDFGNSIIYRNSCYFIVAHHTYRHRISNEHWCWRCWIWTYYNRNTIFFCKFTKFFINNTTACCYQKFNFVFNAKTMDVFSVWGNNNYVFTFVGLQPFFKTFKFRRTYMNWSFESLFFIF